MYRQNQWILHRWIGWLGLLALALVLSGCPKKPPTQAYKKAMDAIKNARMANANNCARDELESAERMLARAKKLMDGGKYEKAKTAFDAARKLAEKAKEEAQQNADCGKPKPPPARPKATVAPPPPRVVTVPETPQVDNRSSLDTVFFDFNKYNLSERAMETLRKHAEWLNTYKDKRLEISGHCDTRGSVEYNLALGERRALAVKRFLVSLGIAEPRLFVISYGHQKPFDSTNTNEAHSKNRRAEFRVMK